MDIKLAKAEDVEKLRKEVKNLAETGVAGNGNLFATCTDTRNTLAKTVTVSDSELTLTDGLQITIRFEHGLRSTTHAEGATTLNINGTGAKELWINGVDATDVDDSVANLYVDNSGAITVMYNEASDTYAIVGRESFNGSGTGELVDDAIEERHISNGAVKERHIADGAVGADQLMDISVGTKKVIDGAITEEKLDPTFKDTLATKEDLAQKANESDLRTAESKITANTEKITTLVGDDTGKSVRKIANEELAARLIKNAGNEASLNTLQEIAEWIANHPDDAAAMNVAITALRDVLSGLGSNKGDVKKYIDNAIAALNIGDYAKASELTAVAGQVSDVAYKLNSFLNTGYEGTPEYVNIKEIADDIKSVRESVPSLDGYATEEYLAEELTKRGQLKPEYANSIEECTDTSKLYVLPDGYIYAYTLTTELAKTYTNLADPTSSDWAEGYRFNSTGELVALDGFVSTNYIPVAKGDVVRIKGVDVNTHIYARVAFYNSSKAMRSSTKLSAIGSYGTDVSYDTTGGQFTIAVSDHPYIRFCGTPNSASSDVIITVNEEIKEEVVTSYKWTNTGHAFVPADYEDRINDLEDGVLNLKNKVETMGDVSSEAVTIPSYWDSMVKEKTETIKALQTAGGKDCICFAWASDTHIPDNDNGRTTDLGKVMAKMLDNCEIPFAMLSGDINTRASHSTEDAFVKTQLQISEHLAPLWGTDRLLMALGNHDGCYGDSTGYYRHQFTPERMWQIFFRGQTLDFRRVFSDDGLYFYVDNIAQKTRFIVLNSHFGGKYSEDINGWAVNNRFGTSCYGQAQLDWLADVALDMPSGYSAIITAHVPPNIAYTVDKEQLIGIINAYCNKTTYSGSYTAGVDGWTNNNISVDFTDAKGEIIAMFAGHVHGDSVDTTTLACPLITILSAGASANEPYKETAPTRTSGTDTETSFDVVTINKATRTISCTRVGAGTDREISY